MDKVLFWKKWFDSIDIDINYFNIDYYNPNSIKEKIIELCSMSISEVQEKYKDSFQKEEENKIKINNFIKKDMDNGKYDLLIGNGCSFTEGGGLTIHESTSF